MFNYYTKKIFIFILYVVLAFVLPCKALYSLAIGEFYSLEYPNDKKIYFGPYFEGDSVVMSFVAKSFVADTLEIRSGQPTFTIQDMGNVVTNEHLNFSNGTSKINAFPILFHKNKLNDTIHIQFNATPTLPFGRKEAMLILGFVNKNAGNDIETALYADTFYIIGKATTRHIDGYDDFINFDSVFINQPKPLTMVWKVRNTFNSKSPLPAIAQTYNLISTPHKGDEFKVEAKDNYPIQFYYSPDNKVYKEWTFEYSPKDTLKDTAELRLLFQPDPYGQPTKIDTAKVKLYGTGVMQHFEIAENTAFQISGDTIDVGPVSVGQNKTINVRLRNKGNIRYKTNAQGQAILHEIDDVPINFFRLAGLFCKSGNSLHNNDIDSFQIEFQPRERGTFVARYVIENDFKERKIRSNNPADYKKTFIIKGTGIAPNLQPEASTLNFGNINSVSNTSSCPNQKDTTITLFNTGNAELRIMDIQTTSAMFQVKTPYPTAISAHSDTVIGVSFLSNKTPALYPANLIIRTNEPTTTASATNDTIALLANVVPPMDAVLALPRLAAKPGTMLSMPLTISDVIVGQPAITEYVSTFDITLAFNPTLLLYSNYITQGTASAGCIIDIDTSQAGRLRVSTTKSSAFQPSDTLLMLQFRTFLGNLRQTEVSIASAKVGISQACDDYISLTLQDGGYAIDSICGTDYKTSDFGGLFEYRLAAPSASAELELSFTLPFNYPAKIDICNSLGDVIETHTYALPAGVHSKTVPLTHYSTGTFYTIFSCGLYRKVVPFIKL